MEQSEMNHFWQGFEKRAVSAELARRAARSALNKKRSVFTVLNAAARKLRYKAAKKSAGGERIPPGTLRAIAKVDRARIHKYRDKVYGVAGASGVEKVFGKKKSEKLFRLAVKRGRQQQKFTEYAWRKSQAAQINREPAPDKKLKAILKGA